MPDQETIDAQLSLLQACRRTLRQYLRQQVLLGEAYAPPAVLNGIEDLRGQIRAIKQTLRAWQVEFEDLPGDEAQPSAPAAGHALPASRRVFISYKRQVFPDETLAHTIYAALASAGHQPFIDRTIQVGADWAATIERAIAESDYFVVLLSESSVHSEMIAIEVAAGARATRATGRARLLPVRVRYTAALPYQLSRDLDRIQYAAWNNDADTPTVIQQLLAAIAQQAALPGSAIPTGAPPGDAPRPYADPRFLESLVEPGGGLKPQSAVYIAREADARLRRELSKPQGTTTTIRAPRQTGKTSLLIRGVAQAQQEGCKPVLIDMQMVEPRFFESLDIFLRYIAMLTASRLRLDPALIERAWAGPLGAPDKLTYFFEDYVLGMGAQIVLAIDEADRLLATPFRDSVFGLLRSWHNSRALNDRWDKLDLLLVISTEPSLLIADQNQSPFNVGTKLVLDDLTPEQIAELNRRYRAPLSDMQLAQLIDLLGGHPYLSSKALYTLVTDTITWDDFARVAPLSGGPFGDHLRSYLTLLQRHPELRAALSQVAANGACADEGVFYRLVQAGLVRGASSQRCRLRCSLYGIYFKEPLA